MYGIVLATALTTGMTAPDFGFHKRGCSCSACYAGCSCGCYGCGCYGCWSSCSYGCSCYGGCASYHGCWTTCGCYGCYGYCGGWGCSCSCYSACAACYGCSGCYGCHTYYGCSTCAVSYGCAVPMAVPGKVVEGKVIEGEVSTRIPATVIVKADPSVVVKVNGQTTTRKTAEESFRSPALVPGRSYTYTVVAEYTRDGKAMTETKEITVSAGRQTVVDFSDLGTAVATAETEPANVTVILPTGAKLTVNDVVVAASGNQTFQTPKLEKGKSYFYTVKAEVVRDGKPVTETRRVDVEAGKAITVDFTTASTLTASR